MIVTGIFGTSHVKPIAYSPSLHFELVTLKFEVSAYRESLCMFPVGLIAT